jgi:NAD(P)-dependent dehydrogenase (short-subunit alcohol dehydrogenase family)
VIAKHLGAAGCRVILVGRDAGKLTAVRFELDGTGIASRPAVCDVSDAASKMAVLGLTRTLAFEAGPRGIRVNSLSPGPVRGERMARNFRLESVAAGVTVQEAERDFRSRAALNRLVEEDEVGASVVAMLQIPGMCGADIDLSAGMIAP